jgi:hypothetical protein
MGPGETIHLVLAEAAASIDQGTALNVGKQYKAGTISAAQKNDSVYTGRDSLFQTFRRALANYNSGYSIPQPPLPPKTFTVTSLGKKVQLQWSVYSDGDPKLTGFEIYRAAGKVYNSYEKIFTGDAAIRSFVDSLCSPGTAYYYYIASLGKSADNNGAGATPAGALRSSRYYTQTYHPVSTITSVAGRNEIPRNFCVSQNYPNPFNPSTVIYYQVPVRSLITIKIFDILGRETAVLVDGIKQEGSYDAIFNASGLASGVYFSRFTATPQNGAQPFTQIMKLVLTK